MKKSLLIVLMTAAMAVSAPAFAEQAASPAAPSASQASSPSVTATRGQMVVAAGGVRLGAVSRLADDGSPKVIFEGRLISIPLSSLTVVDGRLVSSLTRAQIMAAN